MYVWMDVILIFIIYSTCQRNFYLVLSKYLLVLYYTVIVPVYIIRIALLCLLF